MGRYLLGFTLFSLTLVGCDAGTGKDTAVGPKDDSSNITPGCDEDGDGYCESENDCNEGDASISPGATEICDGIDNNCDDLVDEGVLSVYYADADGDGFGDVNNPKELCEAAEGFVDSATDCDDAAKLVFPGATEVCDGIDNNCDGSVDEGVTFTYYQDTDGDGHGDADTAAQYCDAPGAGWVEIGDDCNDNSNRSFPGNAEVCDQIDNNCDGVTDEGVSNTYYADFDTDGYGSSMLSQQACTAPSGYVLDNTDCDDGDMLVHPDGTELCNLIDDDCDGTIDENDAADAMTWYADTDGDTFGDATATFLACEAPAGFVADATDCNDSAVAVNPSATEMCNGIDDDCDLTTDEADAADASTWYIDVDRDSFGSMAVTTVACSQPSGYVGDNTDCNDGSNIAYPNATEMCDSIDNDCDGVIDESAAADASTWYQDADSDTFGNAAVSQNACSQPSGYVARATDCDDNRAQSYPGAAEYCNGYDDDCDGTTDENDALDASTWYVDTDADSYGDRRNTTVACSAPAGYVGDNTDCDDTVSTTYPGALEYCNNADDNCNGSVDESTAVDAQTWYLDADRDSYGNGSISSVSCSQPGGYVSDNTDCNDGSNVAYPGATEVCDGLDNDCDGSADESSAVDASTWYQDADSDTYGNASVSQQACSQPSGYVANSTDCNDGRALSNPGATEYCNGFDDDCDGSIDENAAVDASTWYADTDSDTYGNRSSTTVACSAPAGYVSDNTDCDDGRALSNPGATEYCNGFDDNCNGQTDESTASGAATWYLDADRDTYGNGAISQVACTQPSGYVSDNTDCNDGSSSAYPNATELCDGLDNDCDGAIDENSSANAGTWYRDADADGFGTSATSTLSCSQPTGYVSNATDCNDNRAASYPGAPEYCNGYDDDCDGTTDEDASLDVRTWYQDADSDNYGNSSVVDYDCAQPTGYVEDNTDCNDSRALSNPGATEYCNGFDDDCDGYTDESSAADAVTWYRDADTDSYGLSSVSQVSCSQPVGYVSNSTDCSDLDATAYPGASEYCDGVDDDCDGTIDDNPVDGDTWYRDVDGDTFGVSTSTAIACSQPSGYTDNTYDCNDADASEPVVADAVGGSSGGAGTAASPFSSLQDAIDSAGECVVAMAGTYEEQIDLGGSSLDVWGVEGSAYTIIDAGMPTCTSANPTACGAAVSFGGGSSSVASFRGFTVTGGSGAVTSSTASTTCADSSASHAGSNTCTVTTYEYRGGGIYINGDDPELSDIIVRDNILPDMAQDSVGARVQYWLYSYGGGIYARDTNATFDGVDVYGNYADQGGGIYVTTSASISYEQGKMSSNEATDGGGVAISGGTFTATNAAIYCNTASIDGGGVFSETSGSAILTNVGFYSNTAAAGLTHGVAAYIGTSTTLYMYNTIAEETQTSAYAIYGSGSGTFTYNNVYAGGTGYRYGGSMAQGAGSISSGSNFTSVTCDSSVSNDNFTLRSGSGSIDTGNPSSVYNDYDGSRNDMGPKGGPAGNWN